LRALTPETRPNSAGADSNEIASLKQGERRKKKRLKQNILGVFLIYLETGFTYSLDKKKTANINRLTF
jgi:hypothetical protein